MSDRQADVARHIDALPSEEKATFTGVLGARSADTTGLPPCTVTITVERGTGAHVFALSRGLADRGDAVTAVDLNALAHDPKLGPDLVFVCGHGCGTRDPSLVAMREGLCPVSVSAALTEANASAGRAELVARREEEAALHSGGILSDVCDAAFNDPTRAEVHGYDSIVDRIKALSAMLGVLEWAGPIERGTAARRCPWCRGMENAMHRHAPGCELAALTVAQ